MAPIAILCWCVYIWNILKISHPLLLYSPYCYPVLVCAHVEHLKEFSSLLLYGPYCYPVLVCVHMEHFKGFSSSVVHDTCWTTFASRAPSSGETTIMARDKSWPEVHSKPTLWDDKSRPSRTHIFTSPSPPPCTVAVSCKLLLTNFTIVIVSFYDESRCMCDFHCSFYYRYVR